MERMKPLLNQDCKDTCSIVLRGVCEFEEEISDKKI